MELELTTTAKHETVWFAQPTCTRKVDEIFYKLIILLNVTT